jgi:hypothetical protein
MNKLAMEISQSFQINKTNIQLKVRNYSINIHVRANGCPSCRSKSGYNIEHSIGDTGLEQEKPKC